MAFVDHGEFEAMKTLISRRAPRCDKDQFRAKMTMSTLNRCMIFCNNSTVILCNSPTVQQCNSATALLCNGATVQQCICEISLLNIVRGRNEKMALSLPHTFAFSCLPRGFWPLV